MRSRRAWLRRAAALCAAAAAWPLAARANDLKLGAPAPPLVLHALDGRQIATRDLRGRVVVATFWATWCDPCREELPLLSAYAARHARDGLVVLGFSLDGADALPEVRQVAATLSFPVGLLGNPWAGGYGRIWRIPVSFVIDREGILRYDGWQAKDPVWTQASLDAVVGPLLSSPTRQRVQSRISAS
jgi:cytochrome c biogenesis protein CcmG, thiol:disulfide interchange protein DsbE